MLASLGQLCMTRAYSLAKTRSATLLVANFQYSCIVFGALYRLVLSGDRIPLIGWAGMALTVASGIAATFLRARAAPDSPPKNIEQRRSTVGRDKARQALAGAHNT